MKINVYKSDFSIFPGLYDAVIYLKSGIVSVTRSYIEVNFGPEHMNPYTIANHHNIKDVCRYSQIMDLCVSGEIESGLVCEIFNLLDKYALSTKQILRKIDNATCYPVGHINRTIIKQ